MDLEKAISTQISNISLKTGKGIDELVALVSGSGLQKHADKLAWVKANLGLGHGDANALVLHASKLGSPEKADADVLDQIYAGPKAALRPIHEAIMKELDSWGDFEVHPKKGYVALRRKKQFAMLGPGSNSRFDLGLNSKALSGSDRLKVQPSGGMCQYKVAITDPSQVDAEIFEWVRTVYAESA